MVIFLSMIKTPLNWIELKVLVIQCTLHKAGWNNAFESDGCINLNRFLPLSAHTRSHMSVSNVNGKIFKMLLHFMVCKVLFRAAFC